MFLTAAIKTILFGANKKPSLGLDFSKTPQIDPRLTWARNITSSVVSFEGLIKTAKANEARFANARRVENLIPKPEVLTVAGGWTLSSCTNPGTPTAVAPDGTTTAWVITATGSATIYLYATQPTGNTATSSWWIRRVTGTGNITFLTVGGAAGSALSGVSSTWKRFSYTGTQSNTKAYIGVRIETTGDVIEVWHPLLEDVTGQANQNPSEYVSANVLAAPYHGAGVDGVKYFPTTNGNTVASSVVTEAVGTPLAGPITLLAEEARTNLLLNSATPATQNITTTAQAYTISMSGTGTCTLTGTATGTLTGTGAGNRVSLTVTATAGTLTLTFAGTNTNGQAEAGTAMSSYISTAGTAIARPADVASFTGAGLSWYNTQQGTFVITASGQAFRTPSPFGTFNLTLPTAGTYALQYNNAVTDGSTYLYTAAGGATPTEYTGIAVPTTILLLNGGLVNISNFTYYASALPTATIVGMLT